MMLQKRYLISKLLCLLAISLAIAGCDAPDPENVTRIGDSTLITIIDSCDLDDIEGTKRAPLSDYRLLHNGYGYGSLYYDLERRFIALRRSHRDPHFLCLQFALPEPEASESKFDILKNTDRVSDLIFTALDDELRACKRLAPRPFIERFGNMHMFFVDYPAPFGPAFLTDDNRDSCDEAVINHTASFDVDLGTCAYRLSFVVDEIFIERLR